MQNFLNKKKPSFTLLKVWRADVAVIPRAANPLCKKETGCPRFS
jgi:hypothetical protein